jgi:hypothetical protein
MNNKPSSNNFPTKEKQNMLNPHHLSPLTGQVTNETLNNYDTARWQSPNNMMQLKVEDERDPRGARRKAKQESENLGDSDESMDNIEEKGAGGSRNSAT